MCGIAKYIMVMASNAALNMTDAVAYLRGISWINDFVPRCSAQIPNTSVRENVNSTALKPKKKPDNVVIAINVAIVLAGRRQIQFVARCIHFDFGVNAVALVAVDFMI